MTRQRIKELLDREGPRIRERFRSVMQRVKDQRTISELENALAEGRIAEVLDDIEAAAAALAGTTEAVHTAVAQEVAGVLSAKLDALVTYDTTDPRAVDRLRANRARMVAEITNEQREVIVDALAEGTARGDNPRAQARAIRDTIGLTQQQAGWVRSYRRKLETLDPGALDMELRDGRHDGQTQRAIDSGKPLDPAQIDRMVDRYTERAIKYRAEVIGRTEALAAVHQGQHAAYEQAIETGVLDAEQMTGKWLTGPRARPWHASMHGQTQPWGSAFVSGHGVAIHHPGEQGLPADEVANCNCSVVWRLAAPSKNPPP